MTVKEAAQRSASMSVATASDRAEGWNVYEVRLRARVPLTPYCT